MKKISIKNLFKKSESDTEKSKNKLLITLLIILIVIGVVYLGYPLIFPDKSVKPTVTTTIRATTPSQTTVATKTESKPEIIEKTPFEIEMEKRKEAYENKIFVYKPYEPPSNRNPFQKVSTSYFLGEAAGKKGEEGKEGSILRFPKPELPPGTKLTGIIGTEDKKLAMIEMNGETFIAKLYDILIDKYIVKEIKEDEVIIDFNGYDLFLKIGGEEASNE